MGWVGPFFVNEDEHIELKANLNQASYDDDNLV